MKVPETAIPNSQLKQLFDNTKELAQSLLQIKVDFNTHEQINELNSILCSLCHKAKQRQEEEARLNQALDLVMSLARLDFDKRVEIKSDASRMDGLAAGLNMLAEELQSTVVSKRKLSQIINAAPGILYTRKDIHNFSVTFISPTISNFGYYPEEFTSNPNFWIERIHPDDKQKVTGDLSLLLQNKRHVHEYRFLKKDGNYAWIRDEVCLEFDEQGNFKEAIGFFSDISSQKILEDKLSESNKLWQFALEGSGDGVWDWDISSNSVFFSKRWKKMLGHEENEIQNSFTEWKKRIHPEDLPIVMQSIQAHLETKATYHCEYRVLCKNGQYKWILARGMVTNYADDGTPMRMIGTHTDITLIKQAEKQLVHSSKMASLGEISAGIAHEINNPLAIISGSINLLTKYIDQPEKFASSVSSINKSCQRIAKIVMSLRKFSRSDVKADMTLCPLSNIVTESIALSEFKAVENSIKILCDISSNAQINCCEVEIEQVVINLINNAIDAIKVQSEKWIKIIVFQEEQFLILRIIDSGCGLPESVLDKLFDPFFTTKKVGEGTGLGLSLSKGILDEHGASISIVPHMSNTCFEVRFPLPENKL